VSEPPQRPDGPPSDRWRAPNQSPDDQPTTPLWPMAPGSPRPYQPPPAPPYGPSPASPPQAQQPPSRGEVQWGHTAQFGAAPPRGQTAPPGWFPPDRAPQRSRVPWLLLGLVTLLLGLAGGALGATVVEAASSDNATSTATSAGRSLPSNGPVSGSPLVGGVAGSPVVSVAERVLPSVVSIDVIGSSVHVSGAGFVYDQAGHIVTNNHVIEPAVGGGTIKVTLPDGHELSASIVGRSPSYDLAVLSVDRAAQLTPATLGSSAGVRVGETVVAIGSPLGLSSTVTSGIISATDRPVTAGGSGESSYINALQTDAAINPGNSGGPLVDLSASVIGVNSAIATLGGSAQRESGNIGVGFAIPIDQVRRTVEQIIATGHAVYPIIGAEVSVATSLEGARINAVTDGSPAATAGIRAGDVVTEVNGRPVHDGIELIVQIRSFEPGQTVTLTVDRDGTTSRVPVVLGKKVG
jgi:putative serine protease PepD